MSSSDDNNEEETTSNTESFNLGKEHIIATMIASDFRAHQIGGFPRFYRLGDSTVDKNKVIRHLNDEEMWKKLMPEIQFEQFIFHLSTDPPFISVGFKRH